MADAVTNVLIENGSRWWVARWTNVSDSTGETGVVKLDPTSTGPLGVSFAGNTLYPGVNIAIREIQYDVGNMKVRLQWDATVAQDIQILAGFNRLKFDKHGGIQCPRDLAGVTGKILLTTIAQMPNSTYTIDIRGTKGFQR